MNELEQFANEIIESAPEELRNRLREIFVGGQESGFAIINTIQAWSESDDSQDLHETESNVSKNIEDS
jgi:hypothetical protein